MSATSSTGPTSETTPTIARIARPIHVVTEERHVVGVTGNVRAVAHAVSLAMMARRSTVPAGGRVQLGTGVIGRSGSRIGGGHVQQRCTHRRRVFGFAV